MTKIMKKITAALALGGVLALAGCAPAYAGDTTDCTVNDKAALVTRAGGTDYRIYSTCGVFGVQDDMFLGQWNSADTYNTIEIGKTYDFEAYGWRNGFFSTFPNIIKATEVAR